MSRFRDILESIKICPRDEPGRLSIRSQNAGRVECKMLIISEAAIRLSDVAESLRPGIPWRDIRGIGNWLRHQYDRVDIQTTWNTIQQDLPPLKAAVERALALSGN